MDILFKNATIVDGSGAPPYLGDVAVHQGKIAKIAENLSVSAQQVIDLEGKYLTPGFIDGHRHSDAVVFHDDFGEVQLRQGVTTTINGNCGLSIVPAPPAHRQEILDYLRPITGSLPKGITFETMGEYLEEITRRGTAINFGMLQGNGTLRMAVNGFEPGKLSSEQVEKIHSYLEESVASGAFGISLGIIYMPENLYEREDFVQVLAPIRGGKLPITTHMRGEGDILVDAIQEVIDIAEALDIPLHISHFKCVGPRNWGVLLDKAFALIEDKRAGGMTITYDVYPWQAGSSQLVQVLPPSYLEGGMDRTIQRLSDPVLREQCIQLLKEPQTEFENLVDIIGWENIMISSVQTEENQRFVGMRATEVADTLKKDVYEAMLDLIVEEKGDIAMVNFITSDEDIVRIMKDPYSHIVSDSIYPDSGLPHPRQYGTHAKVLEEYVHQRGVLSVEQAVHKMSGRPATLFEIKNKGYIKEGYDADLVAFAIEQVKNHATYTDPRQFATGFSYVLVNGEIVCENDIYRPKRAGKVIRRGR